MASESSGTTTDESSNIKWSKSERRSIFQTMIHALRSMGDYNEYISSLYDENITDGMHVANTLRYMDKYNLLPFNTKDVPEYVKDRQVSIDLRNKGNKHFMTKNEEALLLYSQSIAAAPYPTSDKEESEELALGFANRSAVYYVMKKYEACLRDIEQALMFNYPDKLRFKLLERRAKCYQSLGRKDEACASAQESLRSLSAASLTEDKMKSTVEALGKLQLEPIRGAMKSEPTEASDDLKPLPQKAFGQHKNIPCASECVDIAYNPSVGRHIVANRDIDPGMVLFVEAPYASLLEPDCHFTHCNNCSKRSDAMIPCRKCDQVMYCSDTCRVASWESYHREECQLLPALRRLDVGTSGNLLALRILLISCSKNNGIVGLFKLDMKLNQTMNQINNIKGFNDNGNYLSSDYQQVNDLFRNIRRETSCLLTWASGAACILNGLQTHTEIFSVDSKDSNNESMKDVVSFTGGLLFKFLQVINSNVFVVTDYVREAHDATSKDVDIAWGLYPTLSLLNHSCNPSAVKSFHNGAVNVVIARQPIRKGEEVSLSYGDYYDDTDFMTRRAGLKYMYYFNCQCIACVNYWPTYDHLDTLKDPTFICKSCCIPLPKKSLKLVNQNVKCTRCDKKYDVSLMNTETKKLRSRVTDIYKESDKISNPEYISELASMIKILDSLLLNPNQLMNDCQEYLRQSMKTSGNFVHEKYTRGTIENLHVEITDIEHPARMDVVHEKYTEVLAITCI